jgi:hypothetical protein
MQVFKTCIVFWGLMSAFFAQELQVHLTWNNSAIQMQKAIKTQFDSVIFTKCYLYLQGLEPSNSVHQLHLKNPVYLLKFDSAANIKIKIPNVLSDTLKFGIGIDSTLHVKGIQSGVLDPIHGMYWTWQSGYINFKLEGQIKVQQQWQNFQFHIGGYRSPYNCFQYWNCYKHQYNLDLFEIVNPCFKSQQFKIMSPGIEAFEFSKRIPYAFHKK